MAAPLPKPEDIRPPAVNTPVAPYFANYVKQQLVDEYGAARLFGGGFACRTSIDLECRRRRAGRSRSGCTNPNGPTAALVAIDPRDGSVVAMVGGENFRESQFNLAAQGSAPAGLGVQAVRARRGAPAAGSAPATTFQSKPLLDLARRPLLVGAQLRERLPRQRRRSTRRRPLRQHDLRAADADRRPEGRREDRACARRQEPPRFVLRDRSRRARPSTRSRWRARSRRSRRTACASTDRSSATCRARWSRCSGRTTRSRSRTTVRSAPRALERDGDDDQLDPAARRAVGNG